MGVKSKPKPFTILSIDHILGIGNVLFDLQQMGQIYDFTFEIREDFISMGKEQRFSADGFFGFNNRAYLLEYQLSPISSLRWAEKWEVYNRYLGSTAFHKAFWNKHAKGQYILPQTIVVTKQQTETVKTGCRVPCKVVRDIKELI